MLTRGYIGAHVPVQSMFNEADFDGIELRTRERSSAKQSPHSAESGQGQRQGSGLGRELELEPRM